MRNYFNYFTEIEERFQQRRGSLLMLSTLDWALIDTWREAGLPLDVVLRGIDTAFDHYDARVARSQRRVRRPNGLAWCAEAVLESAEQASNASLAPAESTPAHGSSADHATGFEHTRIAAFLRSNADRLSALTALPPLAQPAAAEAATRLQELANALANTLPATPLEDFDRTLTVLEEKLTAALLATTPEPILTSLRAEADTQLAPYRSRMKSPQIRQLQAQFLHKRLLELHNLPRLSLFYMSVA